MRWVIALVFPVPAPASTHTGPERASATARCSGSSAVSSSSASTVLWCRMSQTSRASAREGAAKENCCTTPKIAAKQAVSSPRTTWRPPVPLTMNTTPWCWFCKNVKPQLTKGGIEMDEGDIERDPEAAKFVESVNGGNQTVPTLLFADGATMSNPSAAQVQKKIAELAATQAS